MPSCLGLFIENNLIKYAKITKDHNITKIDSFGIKFYDRLNDAINQIISETYSYKIPISINLSDEMYNYFYMFSLLNKNDIKKAINTEFESYCFDKGLNINALDSKYILVDKIADTEKIKVIYIYSNKTEIARKEQQLEGKIISNISPLPISISNLLENDVEQNVAIVNIENKTIVTTIIDKKINHVYTIDEGTENILQKINEKENSYSKAYEACKQSTIYTLEGKELQDENNEYLEDIMPTLYNIADQVKKITDESLEKIEKIYITGTASVINNIDLYFQEYLTGIECEILKPYFINKEMASINIKDYIEVNSAIALALQGLGEGLRGVNFKNNTLKDTLISSIKLEKPSLKAKNPLKDKVKIDLNLSEKLDNGEKNLLRLASSILTIIIIYSIFSIMLSNQIEDKQIEVNKVIQNSNSELQKLDEDISSLKNKILEYSNLRQNLESINQEIAQKYSTKNAIPNLLNKIMFIIPQEVKITSIQNISEKHIEIKAESSQYEQLGYFKAKLKTDMILTNVTSDSGIKQDNMIKVTIKGELP